MDVVFRLLGEIVIHNLREIIDIDSTGCDVRGEEDLDLSGLKVTKCFRASVLTLVAMNRNRADPLAFEVGRKLVRASLGSGKDEGLSPVVRFDEFHESVGLTGSLKRDEVLRHGPGRRVPWADGNLGRVVDQPLGELADVIRKSRGEHEVLAIAGKLGDDLLDVVDESHVEHAVRFIENENFERVEFHSPLVDEVEKATRSGDQDVSPLTEFFQLWAGGDATKDDVRAKFHVLSVGRDALGNLRCEFTSRSENQGADLLIASARSFDEPIEERKGKARGLAGSRLRRRHDIPPRHDRRDRLSLNG